MQDNLPELRDIHLPGGVSFFPPAYGWGVILAAAIAAVLVYRLIIFLRRKSKKLYALKLLGQVNPRNIVAAAVEISAILRRICVYKYPAANALFGKEWIVFLNNHSKETLGEKTAALLANAPYIPAVTASYGEDDIESLADFAKKWIGENL